MIAAEVMKTNRWRDIGRRMPREVAVDAGSTWPVPDVRVVPFVVVSRLCSHSHT